ATREVAWPITTSALTTICAFVPLLLWPGIMGEFMGYLPRTVIITLSASLFVALVINPSVAAVLLKKKIEKGHRPFTESRFAKLYAAFLRLAILHRWSTLVLAFGSLFFMIHWFGKTGVGTEFFPTTEPQGAYINVELPEGSSLDTSDIVVRLAEDAALQFPESEAVVASVGATGGLFGSGGGKSNESQVTIEFVDREFRKTPSSEIVTRLRESLSGVSGAEITVDKPQEGPPTGAPVNLEISGEDFEQIGRIALEAKERLRRVEGIVDLKDNFVIGKPELEIKVDKEKAALLGLTTQMVGNTVRTALQGTKAGVYRVRNDEYDVVLRMPKAQRSTIDALERLCVASLSGAQVPISTVADFEWSSGLGSIERVDEKRTVTVSADVAPDYNQNAVLTQAIASMREFPLPPGVTARFTGQNEEQQESQAFLSQAFFAAIFLIALVLVMQFDSIVLPFIIMTSVILSLTGVFLGLVLTKQPFGIIMTGLGVISLAGVVVNNSIVLIDYVERIRRQGLELQEAVIRACTIRLRPVLLTAITTILGLIPMATGVCFNFRKLKWEVGGEMSQFWSSMAIAVIFGLAMATLLTLVVAPTLYVILDKVRAGSYREKEIEREMKAFAEGKTVLSEEEPVGAGVEI
ncbi:efflux RND transporter permease subunit, partial [bacterium]|nr:efflux RND transporter permease subunit [bacterium]